MAAVAVDLPNAPAVPTLGTDDERRELARTRADRSATREASRPAAVAVPETQAPPPAAAAVVVKAVAAAPTRKSSSAAPKAKKKADPKDAGVAPPPAAGRAAVVIAYALAQRGAPYVHGAAGPNAYDCSGLVLAAFARVGIRLPHKADAIGGMGVAVARGAWQPGDVLHWPGHVAIYLGGGKMVSASRVGVPVRISAVYDSPTARRLL